MHAVCALAIFLITTSTTGTATLPERLTLSGALQTDINGDNAITLREAVANLILLEHFASIDTNRDGLLSPAELAQVEWPILSESGNK